MSLTISSVADNPLIISCDIDFNQIIDVPLILPVITIRRSKKDVYYQNKTMLEEIYTHNIVDDLLDRIIVKTTIGGKTIMSRKIQNPSKIQPLQMDTAIIVPKSTVPGVIGAAKNIVGSKLASLIKADRISFGIPMPNGTYRFEVVSDGGATKYVVTNIDTGFKSAPTDVSATPNTTLIPGVSVTVEALTDCVAGDYADVTVLGDTTFIVPGTVLGRLKNGANKGKYVVANDTDIDSYDAIRISAGTLETDPDKKRIGSDGSSTIVNADTMTVAVYVFAQLTKSVCEDINLTTALEAKIKGIVWD